MRSLLEFLVFGGTALGLHAAALMTFDTPGSGQDDAQTVTVSLSAGPELAALVAEWDSPPQTASEPTMRQVEAPEAAPRIAGLASAPPAPSAGDLVAPVALGPAPDPSLSAAELAEPQADLPPSLRSNTNGMTETPMAALPAPVAEIPLPLPDVQAAPSEPEAPKAAPRPARRAAQAAAPPRKVAKPKTGAVAARASASKAAVSSAAGAGKTGISSSERKALLREWGKAIQTRILSARPRSTSRGTAIVEVTVTSSGKLAALRLARSSGSDRLDAAILEAVKRAGRFPAAPTRIGSGNYTFAFPVKSQ